MKNKKIVTNDDLISSLSIERQNKINKEVAKNVKKWGGNRENAGRKPILGKVLRFTKRLTEDEVKFIDYARKNHLNYEDLMEN